MLSKTLFIYVFQFLLFFFFVDVRTEMDEDEDNVQDDSRTRGDRRAAAHAQYVSVNCVVFTHYTGDVANVVDEHFSRALNSDQKLNNAHQTSTKGEWPKSFDLNFNAIKKVRTHNKIQFIQRACLAFDTILKGKRRSISAQTNYSVYKVPPIHSDRLLTFKVLTAD